MLEAASLLPIYGRFEATRNEIAWLSFNKCLGFNSALKPTENVVGSPQFCPDFNTRSLLVCGEGRIRENASRFEEKSWGIKA